jgi:glyoxylase-like metal-dependent hydrolase (beta-lactamase superfamily II)
VPTGFPVGPVNLYLLEGGPLTLIDTGPRSEETMRMLEQGLETHGYKISDIERLIVTHTHPDHFGLVGQIVSRSGASIWTHPYNAEWFNDLDNAVMRRGLFTMQVFQDAGVPSPSIEAMGRSGGRMGRMFETAPTDHWLNEGDTIRMGGADWQVLHTPGHANGHISFYQPDTKQMIAGDHLIKHISPNPMLEAPREYGQPRGKSLAQFVDSMQRVAHMDVSVAYSGHGEDIHEHRALIAQRLAFHEARMDHIAGLLETGERTAYELMRILFPKLTDFEIFLGLSEVIGHLDILEDRGRVIQKARDGHLVYAANA